MARSIRTEVLTPDECRVVVALLVFVSRDCNNPGAFVGELDLPAEWRADGSRKIFDLCEGLVGRGVFLRQYGENYRHYTHRGKVGDWSKVWYSFNESLFVRACRVRGQTHFDALAESLAPHVTPSALVSLVAAVLTSAGLLIESQSTKPLPKKRA